jgi:hypothetical protein
MRKIMMGKGIQLVGDAGRSIEADRSALLRKLDELGLAEFLAESDAHGSVMSLEFRLRDEVANEWAPYDDTTQLCQKLNLDTLGNADDLEREILVSMLLSPVPFQFPSFEEVASAVRIRANIVTAARKTLLDFNTTDAERPDDLWTYHEDSGFTVLPGKSLITALRKATQPEESGKLYSFSCYRATEYVILLGISQELDACNPALLARLQKQWETRAIKSAEFHEVFLQEYGSMDAPLPIKYYVPGDRLWFRNPDNRSSDVTGYEGSWVFYLGNGLFSNFWKKGEPYTLTQKCLEIYHWRDAIYMDAAGELQIDEAIVETLVQASMSDRARMDKILGEMLRLRESKGCYGNGGCIDASRECARFVCRSTSNILV